MSSENDPEFKPPPTLSVDGSALKSRDEGALPESEKPMLRVGDYSIVREISRGAMGVVYEAQHSQLQRVVALKMILSGRYAGDRQLARFRTEAEAAAALDHPHIVPIYDIGSADGNAFFTMKLLNGGDLFKHIKSYSGQPRRIAELMLKISRAVHFAHQRGILHRDLKPANILFDQNGEPFVADFGLAKRVDEREGARTPSGREALTESGMVVGTPTYMSPEQAAGNTKTITTSTDVYSLGAILYELLAGQPPFTAVGLLEILTKVQTEKPKSPRKANPQADAGLALICMRCLEKDPASRYESAEALALDLERWLRGQPLSVNPSNILFRAFHWVRTNTRSAVWSVGIGLAFALSLYTIIDTAVGEQESIRKVYEHFPSIDAPLNADRLHPDKSALVLSWNFLVICVMVVIVLVMMTSWGLILAWLTRAKTAWDDLFAGLTSGFTAVGMLLFLCSGWVLALFLNHSEIGKDMRLISGQLEQPAEKQSTESKQLVEDDAKHEQRVQDAIVERYADMKNVSPVKRREILMEKVKIDIQFGTPRYLALYLLSLCCVFVGASVSQSMAAGFLIRRGDSVLGMVLPYFELSFAWFICIYYFCETVGRLLVGGFLFTEPLEWIDIPELLFFLVPSLVAIVGTAMRWGVRRRLLVYFFWFAILVGLVSNWGRAFGFALIPVIPLAIYEFKNVRKQNALSKSPAVSV